MKAHHYKVRMEWTGNTGSGTVNYRSYKRDHIYKVEGKPVISGSSDPSFLGDPARHNPEELLVASLSSCHMLWYLHLCASHGITVMSYHDEAEGLMEEGSPEGGGKFTQVTLNPVVTISDATKVPLAESLHHEANKYCFIANSCNFPVKHHPVINT